MRSKVCQLADLCSSLEGSDPMVAERMIEESVGAENNPLKVLYKSLEYYLAKLHSGQILAALDDDHHILRQHRDIVALRVITEKNLKRHYTEEAICKLTSTKPEDMLCQPVKLYFTLA